MLAVHTVYKPQENLFYMQDWLEYHSHLGFKKFFMYDNGDSFADSHRPAAKEIPLKNKYGYDHDIGLAQARKEQEKIFSNFNVELVRWSPADEAGVVGYGQAEAIKDYLSSGVKSLTAFIDIDEYIIKKESFRPSRMVQKKYHHLKEYSDVRTISKCIPDLNTASWGTKVILDAQDLSLEDIESILDPHMIKFDLPLSKSYFNHYNYNAFTHNFLVKNISQIDPSFSLSPYPQILKEEESINDVRKFFNKSVG